VTGSDARQSGDSPFDADETGWQAGGRAEDRDWLDKYGYRASPANVANPVDVLPPGYPAYTAVLHRLTDPDTDVPTKWVTEATGDPWDQVQHIVEHGLGSWRFAAEQPMTQPEDAILADILGLDRTGVRLTASWFFPGWEGTILASTIADRLRAANGSLGLIPTFWFPHSRAWVAGTPYDAGWTYLATDTATAYQLLTQPDLEVLRCRHEQA
jgi:hypothetical protein